MGNITTKLKFSRCRHVLQSREAAMIHLKEREFSRGEPAIVNYYENTHVNSSINTLVAVGIRNGRGKDCFRVITAGQFEIVWGVTDMLPDISSLIHDEVYLYKDEHGVWWYVSAPDKTTRTLLPLIPAPHTFLNLADNNIYVSDENKQVRSIVNVYSKEEIDSLIATIAGEDWGGLGNLERRLSDAYEAIQDVIERNDELAREIQEVVDAVSVVAEFSEQLAAIQNKTACLELDQETNTVAGTFSSITLSNGAEDEEPIVLNKDNIVTVDMIGDAVEPIPDDVLEEELT